MSILPAFKDIGDLKLALEKAKYVKENPFADQALGKIKPY